MGAVLGGIAVAAIFLGGISMYVDHRAKRSQEKSMDKLDKLDAEVTAHGEMQKRILENLKGKKAQLRITLNAAKKEMEMKAQNELGATIYNKRQHHGGDRSYTEYSNYSKNDACLFGHIIMEPHTNSHDEELSKAQNWMLNNI